VRTAVAMSITESVTKRKRKRRKKTTFDNSGLGVAGVVTLGGGSQDGLPMKRNDGLDTPYVHTYILFIPIFYSYLYFIPIFHTYISFMYISFMYI